MKVRRRRVWTWLVTLGAGFVLLAAVASGMFQLAVQAMPGYRADIERYVSQVAARPVRIGAIALTWHYYYPSLDLSQVALMSSDGARPVLAVDRLRLGFALTRLVRADFMPDRLELSGLTLALRLDRDRHLHLDAMEEDDGDDQTDALRTLAGFAGLRIERCRLELRDERRPAAAPLVFGLDSAALTRGLLGRSLQARVTLPPAYGERAVLKGTFDGDLLEPSAWSGHFSAQVQSIAAGPWLAPYLAPGAHVQLSGANAQLDATLERGQARSLQLRLQADAVNAQRAQHRVAWTDLDAQLGATLEDEGWEVQLRRVALGGARGVWPRAGGILARHEAAGGAVQWSLSADFLRLDDLAPWLSIARAPGRLEALSDATGEVRDLSASWQADEGDELRYTLRANVEALALPARGRAAGVSGVGGEVAADEKGGRMVLASGPVTLELPGVLLTPSVPLESLDGAVEWRRLDGAWRVGMPQLSWKLWSLRGEGDVALTLPDDAARSPDLAVHARFSAGDATQAKVLMPNAWGRGLIDYLDRAVIAGRAPKAQLTIEGPLRDFPFTDKPGTFALDIEAKDGQFAFQPDWPAVEDVDATLKFRGNSLAIESSHGSIAGNALRHATATFADFARPDLVIDGAVEGEVGRMYDFVNRSPLRETLAALVGRTTARGPARVDIHLVIPVQHAEDTRVEGRIAMNGVELKHRSLPEPVRDIRGELAFNGTGQVTAPRVTASLYGQPVDVAIQPQRKGSLLRASLRMAVDPAGGGASSLVPAWLLRHLSGSTSWNVHLPIGGQSDAPLTLTTDLAGIEVRFPPPLGKSAAESVPLTLTVGETPDAPLHLTVDYHDRFGADLRMAPARTSWTVRAAALRLGPAQDVAVPEQGVVLAGTLPDLDIPAWQDALAGAGVEDNAGFIRSADLQLGRVRWGRYSLRDLHAQWAAVDAGWTVTLMGRATAGMLRWDPRGERLWRASFDHLAVDVAEPVPAAGVATPEKKEPPFDPGAAALLDLDLHDVVFAKARTGVIRLRTSRIERGQRIETLRFGDGALEGTVEGQWQRRAQRSTAAFKFDLGSRDPAGVLRAIGYTPNLDAKRGHVKGELAWEPSADGLDWQRARGGVALQFEDGQLKAVDPGAGRVLGLINFYALPRRLTLNFRDVVSKGLGFDRVSGDFALAEGNAVTENLVVKGPSLRMEVRGRIGLAARDYDERINVYPDLSAGVTLGAVLLGGPAVGALVLIAQQILDKPLQQVTEMSYRITGSWDNPQVERAGEAEPGRPAPQRTPGPPSQLP